MRYCLTLTSDYWTLFLKCMPRQPATGNRPHRDCSGRPTIQRQILVRKAGRRRAVDACPIRDATVVATVLVHQSPFRHDRSHARGLVALLPEPMVTVVPALGIPLRSRIASPTQASTFKVTRRVATLYKSAANNGGHHTYLQVTEHLLTRQCSSDQRDGD